MIKTRTYFINHLDHKPSSIIHYLLSTRSQHPAQFMRWYVARLRKARLRKARLTKARIGVPWETARTVILIGKTRRRPSKSKANEDKKDANSSTIRDETIRSKSSSGSSKSSKYGSREKKNINCSILIDGYCRFRYNYYIIFTCRFPLVTYLLSLVTCHLSLVTCLLSLLSSLVSCLLSNVTCCNLLLILNFLDNYKLFG